MITDAFRFQLYEGRLRIDLTPKRGLRKQLHKGLRVLRLDHRLHLTRADTPVIGEQRRADAPCVGIEIRFHAEDRVEVHQLRTHPDQPRKLFCRVLRRACGA